MEASRIHEILSELRRRRAKLWVEDDRLRCQALDEELPPELVSELRARSHEIIDFLRTTAHQRSSLPVTDRIPARAAAAGPPALSIAQEGLWYLDQVSPGHGLYNAPMGIRLSGRLDVSALRRSLNAIVSRHESLRTVLTVERDRPVQTISRELELELDEVDLSDQSATERKRESERRLKEEARQPFDLAEGPLVRARLIRLDAEEHVLCVVTHHVVFDGWSAEIMRRELAQLYEAFTAGRPSPLAELPIQYADYSDWHRAWCESDNAKRQLSYWREQLSGELPVLELPTDRPRPATMSFEGATESLRIPNRWIDELSRLAQSERATLFMALLAIYQTLLHRYSSQEDILVGSPVLGRPREETEGLIGFFVNPVVLRTDVNGELAFRDLLSRVRRVCLDAFAHQETPFEHVVAALRLERDPSRTPVFQTLLSFQDVRDSVRTIGDITMEPLRLATGSSRTDLTAFLYAGSEFLEVVLEYSTELFEASTIRRFLGHFEKLVEDVVRAPERRVGELSLLTEPELHQLDAWNATGAPVFEGCVYELVAQQFERIPEAVAVESRESRLSYAELEARANELACHLQSLGVRPGEVVGICMERSALMVVALLGILEAGAAYLPLDPNFPEKRLRFMLEDSGARWVVTESALFDRVSSQEATTICIDTDEATLSAYAGNKPEGRATADDLAYVIYTSGSTGNPKGVQVPHRAVVNFLTSMAREPGMTSEDTMLAVTTISFDISVLELFLPLTVGAKVVVATTETASDGPELMAELKRSSATVMQATPTTWRLLVASGWQGEPALKVLCGGEALPADLASELLSRSDDVWNLYGPTETTIWSTCCRLKKDEDAVSIGRPIANTRVYILDPSLRPVPVGVAGDLYIGGAGLTRGYLGRDELTAERFLDQTAGHGKLYRTGDRARFLADGRIQYLGRDDTQVKVRGYRIELGEIETVLSRHPAVAESVSMVRHLGASDHRLIAYYRLEPAAEEPTVTELRQHLRNALPVYMLPSAFVQVEAFPLTPNGKIDRNRLPEPEMFRNTSARELVAPETQLEKGIAAIWQELLGVDAVSVTDNFFELGGHSLLSMQAIFRIEANMGIRLKARDMVLQTLGQLATLCARELGEMKDRAESAEATSTTRNGLLSKLKTVIPRG